MKSVKSVKANLEECSLLEGKRKVHRLVSLEMFPLGKAVESTDNKKRMLLAVVVEIGIRV